MEINGKNHMFTSLFVYLFMKYRKNHHFRIKKSDNFVFAETTNLNL